MPIEIKCQECNARFRVGDQYAGKRVKCAKCRATIIVEAAEPLAAEEVETAPTVPGVRKPGGTHAAGQEPTAAKKPTAAAGSTDDWFMQTEEGEQYGPVPKSELDAWMAEGRLDAGCQLLREGWDQWKWAEEVYPQLSATPDAPPAAEAVVEVAPVTPALPQVAVSPVAVEPVASAATPVAEVGSRARSGRSAARHGHPGMNFAIQTLPICAWIVAGVAGIAASYFAYEFINALVEYGKIPEEVRKMAMPSMTKLVLMFLVSEVAMLVSGFVSFVILRALPEWMAMALKNDQEIQALSEETK